MGICLSTACGCSSETIGFALLGILVFYSFFVFLFYRVFKVLFEEKIEEDILEFLSIIGAIFFPLTIVALALFAVGYWIVLWIIFPFIGATKRDLRQSENRIMERLNNTCSSNKNTKQLSVKQTQPTRKFKVGDLITGIKGNPDGYKYLTEKCVCKVKSITENGDMRVILVDHRDNDIFTKKGYEEFRCPARNFVLYKKSKR